MMDRLTDTQRAELRRLAEQATPGPWWVEPEQQTPRLRDAYIAFGTQGDDADTYDLIEVYNVTNDYVYIAAANPATMLALLDLLDTKDQEIKALCAAGDAAQARADVLEREREQARRNVAYIVGEHQRLRTENVNLRHALTAQKRLYPQARRDALQQAREIAQGVYQRAQTMAGEQAAMEIINDISALDWSDAPPAGATAQAQPARVGENDVLYLTRAGWLQDAHGWVDPRATRFTTAQAVELQQGRDRVQPGDYHKARGALNTPPDAPRGHERADAGVDDVAYLTAAGWEPQSTSNAFWRCNDGPVVRIAEAVAIERLRQDVTYLIRAGWARNLLDQWSHPEHAPHPIGRMWAVVMQRQRDGQVQP